jgi:hypothetical protein
MTITGTANADFPVTNDVSRAISVNRLQTERTLSIGGSLTSTGSITMPSPQLGGEIVINAAGSSGTWEGTVTVRGTTLAAFDLRFQFGPAGPTCDSIDFNADGLFPDTLDIDDFLSVFSGGPCLLNV